MNHVAIHSRFSLQTFTRLIHRFINLFIRKNPNVSLLDRVYMSCSAAGSTVKHLIMEKDVVDVPEYFICPISLQIMKDPVTAVSGITYDRESIERWMFNGGNTTCPVTKQPLPRDSDLTPNHTLWRLIQAWWAANGGVDRIPTPKTPLSKPSVMKLMKDLSRPELVMRTLEKLEALAMENDKNRGFMVEAGLANTLMSFIISCCHKRQTIGLEDALRLLYIVREAIGQSRGPVFCDHTHETVDSLMWILGEHCLDNLVVKSHAAYMLRIVVQKVNPTTLEWLNPDFFKTVLSKLGQLCNSGMNSLLHVLLDACPWGQNRIVLVESGAVSDLIKLEHKSKTKKTTELVLGILCHLCSCADGRAQLVNHASGIGTITRRILRVSSTADDRAVYIIWLISKYTGTNVVLEEMVRIGTVSKLCMVVQSDVDPQVKERAKEILRANSDVWKDLPYMEFGSLMR